MELGELGDRNEEKKKEIHFRKKELGLEELTFKLKTSAKRSAFTGQFRRREQRERRGVELKVCTAVT